MKILMTELDEEILALKRGGASVREIAAALGISHVAVLKRLKTREIGKELVTNDGGAELPSVTKGKENVLTSSDGRQSREYQRSKKVGNQVDCYPARAKNGQR